MLTAILFDFIMVIYAICYLPYMLLTRRFYPGILTRFGFFSKALRLRFNQKSTVWLHAVSVGEVALLEGLIMQLKRDNPNEQLVVTVTTKTGYRLACERLTAHAIVLPSPVDFSLIVRRFIKLIKPSKYIIAETEIWPNLFYVLKRQHIPIVIINARLSDQSFPRYQWIKPLIKPVLDCVTVIGAQSDIDRKRFCLLGADANKVIMLGNLKFDGHVLTNANLELSQLKKDRLCFIAGSTHPGEEEIMLEAFVKLQSFDPRWCLIIAPRHIERVSSILALVADKQYPVKTFSQWQKDNKPVSIIIVDTIGQLASLYMIADIVFVGKSLCVGGGHNIIEPANFGKPILIGPMMDNFKDITRVFVASNAICQVNGKDDFINKICDLAKKPDLRLQLGQRALNVVKSNQGVMAKTISMIKGLS